MVMGLSKESNLARRDGLSAGSRPSSSHPDTGRGSVAGSEPVQRTRRSEEIFVGPGKFSFGELSLTVQLFDCLVSVIGCE